MVLVAVSLVPVVRGWLIGKPSNHLGLALYGLRLLV